MSFVGPFSLSSDVTLPVVTTPGSIGSFKVVFSPAADSAYVGSMTVANNGGDISVPLYGVGFGGVYYEDFGSVESMKEAFINAGIGQFGSGWCWLVLNNGKLEITKTPNAENPIVHGHTPLLGCDVWEHSYYIDFRNKRPVYILSLIHI